jgi:hypothetical protein
MIVCQWHLDVLYGKQGDALRVMRAWGQDKLAQSEFRRARSVRVLVGHVGASASHIVDEYLFDTLADFEAALAGMGGETFRRHSDALAPFVVPGSQHWQVYRVVE